MKAVRARSILQGVFLDAARTGVVPIQFLKDLEEFRIKESLIDLHHIRHVLSTAPVGSLHHMANHLLSHVRVVAVLAGSSKHGIQNETNSCHPKRLGSTNVLLGRLHALTIERLVVIHHRGVNAQLNCFPLSQTRTPKKESLKQPEKQPDANPRKLAY